MEGEKISCFSFIVVPYNMLHNDIIHGKTILIYDIQKVYILSIKLYFN